MTKPLHEIAPQSLRRLRRTLAVVLAIFFLPLGYAVGSYFFNGEARADWRSARRDSSGQAPDPAVVSEAVIQVYAARAVRWRGAFGVHTWVAAKPVGGAAYTRFEVMGFGIARGREAVRVHEGVPDAFWFGSRPTLLAELRGGAEVDALIDRLHRLAVAYPYNHEYRIWPGPNSNTFTAWLTRQLPELSVDMPPTAIGKDYLVDNAVFGNAPSGGGLQVSLGGLIGFTVAPEEGLELNLLGLSAGIDLSPPALKLPGVGRVGFSGSPAP